jgi:hypothetical protein
MGEGGMTDTPQWLIVKLEPLPNGRTDKIPCNYITQQPCNAHESGNWTTHAAAAAVAAHLGQGWTIGFVLTAADPWFCVDIDSCMQADGTWSPLANEMAAALPGCFIETSVSGKGIHIWGRYPNPPAHIMKRVDLHAECYTSLRFIAVGTPLQGTVADRCDAFPAFLARWFPPRETVAQASGHGDGPRPEWRGPADDEELLRRALRSQSHRPEAVFGPGKASFADLWTRNVEVLARCYSGDGDDGIDASSADAALAQHLAFWTGCDADRMLTLMQRSGLRRGKYDREDYLPRTIAQACRQQRDVLQDKPVAAPPSVPSVPSLVPALGPGVPPPPATAPTMEARDGATFLLPEQAAALFANCFYVAEQHRVLVPGGKLYKPEQFNAVFGGHTFVMDARNEKTSRKAFEAFTESQVLRPPIADGVCFRPDLPYGQIVETEGRRRVNSFWPAGVERRAGDVTPFLRHMGLVLPQENDRRIFTYWMANAVQRLGHKSQWFPLLIGVEGNGKSLFSRVLAYTVGHRYSHWPDASKLGNQFNGWIFGKLVICIEDLKIGDALEVWEKLKPMITGEALEIEGKGIDQRTDEICANFIANSNHKNAIRATLNDRRVCHLWCAQQTAQELEDAGMGTDYMSGIYDWLKSGGYAIVADWLLSLPIPDEFGLQWFKGRAPRTSSFNKALAASLGQVEQEVMEAIERDETGFRGGWISSGALDKLLERIGKARFVPPNKRREILTNIGYDWHPGLAATSGRVNNAVAPDGAKVKLFVKPGSDVARLEGAAQIAAAYSAAQGGFAAPGR